jgi:putative ABC transport system substrate-binding protein
MLYDPTDGVAADLARRFESEAGRLGVRALTETSTAAATDADALARLKQRGAKVIYLPPAPGAARYAPLVLEAGRRMQVRVVSSLPEGDHKGAVLWVALDYHKLGEDIGDLARRVLNGEKPKSIPIAEQTPLKVEVDETLARKWSGYPPVK